MCIRDRTVTVTDDDGFGTDTVVVTVNNVAPTVVVSGPGSALEGAIVPYTFTVDDPGDDAFTVSDGYPSCGMHGSFVEGSLVLESGGGSFECSFPDGDETT